MNNAVVWIRKSSVRFHADRHHEPIALAFADNELFVVRELDPRTLRELPEEFAVRPSVNRMMVRGRMATADKFCTVCSLDYKETFDEREH